MAIDVGDIAPEFSLPGSSLAGSAARAYSLSEYRGHNVVLAFYPGDNTPVCTMQLKQYSAEFAEFEGLDAQILALSPQGLESHEAFSTKEGGFAFPLLADTDKDVARAYGVLGPLGFYRRSVFVVAADGKIVYAHRSVTGLTFRKTAELVEVLRAK